MIKHDALQFLVGAALVAASALPAAAAEPGISYFSAHIGRNNLDHWPASVSFGAPTVSGQVNLDEGTHFGIIGGLQYDANRFELEYQHGRFNVTGAALGPLSGAVSGSGHYDALTLGAYRTAVLRGNLSGFAGLGVGAASVSLPQANFTSCNCFPEARSTGWVLQARVGLEYALGSGHSVLAQYTWLSLPGPDAGNMPSVDYDRHHVGVIGLGYKKAF
jgi:hypothetical protein